MHLGSVGTMQTMLVQAKTCSCQKIPVNNSYHYLRGGDFLWYMNRDNSSRLRQPLGFCDLFFTSSRRTSECPLSSLNSVSGLRNGYILTELIRLQCSRDFSLGTLQFHAIRAWLRTIKQPLTPCSFVLKACGNVRSLSFWVQSDTVLCLSSDPFSHFWLHILSFPSPKTSVYRIPCFPQCHLFSERPFHLLVY